MKGKVMTANSQHYSLNSKHILTKSKKQSTHQPALPMCHYVSYKHKEKSQTCHIKKKKLTKKRYITNNCTI